MGRWWYFRIRDLYLFYGEGNANHQLGTGVSVHRRIRSSVKKVEFISDRVSCITLKGRRCDTIVLNVYAPSEDKDYDIKDSFYGINRANVGSTTNVSHEYSIR